MRIGLNLVPATILRRRDQAVQRRTVIVIPVLIIAGVVALFGALVTQERRAAQKARELEQQLVQLRPLVIYLSELQAETTELEQRQQTLRTITGQRQVRLSPLLAEISRLIPQDVWLQSLIVDAGGVTLAGNALDLRSVALFAATLNRSAVVDQVKLQSLQQVSAGRRAITQFQMAARLKAQVP